MLEKFDKIIRVFNKILLGLLVIVMITMLVVCMLHVFFRYVLNNSLSWSEEYMRVALVWFGMLSATVLAARREHVSIVIFKEKMPKKMGKTADRFTQLVTIIVCLVVTVIGVRMSISAGNRSTPAMGLPYSIAYAAIPVAFAIITLYEFRNFLVDINKKGHPFAAVEKPEEDPLLPAEQ